MKILQNIILFFCLWIINLIKYLALFQMKLFKNQFDQDLITEYQFVNYCYQICLSTTIFNQILLIVLCMKTKYEKICLQICNCFIILNIICFYFINLLVINLFRESQHFADRVVKYYVYLEEIIFCTCWIVFLIWIYVKLNGRYQDIINKFSSFGIIKIIFYLTLDLQSIIFQIYICVTFGIMNNSDENLYIRLILISIPLIVSIGQIFYVIYYVNKQIFMTFGISRFEFKRYSQFKILSISILLLAIILEFLEQNTIFDLLFVFFVYGSIRLFNLRIVQKQYDSLTLLSNQFTTLKMASQLKPLECSICQKEYTYLDNIIQSENITYHKQCKHQIKTFNLPQGVNQQINLSYNFYDSEQQFQYHLNLLLILIVAIDFIYYIARSYLLTKHYKFYDVTIRVFQIIFYNIIIFLQDYQKKQFLKLRVILLFLVYLSYYINLHQLYFQLNIYDETESTVYAILQNLLLISAQSINLIMIQQVYYPIIDLKQAVIIYFLRTLTINQVIYLFVYTYQIYDVDDNYIILSQIPVALYFAIYLINFDRLSIRDIFKIDCIKPYQYYYHQNLSKLFLIIISIYQLFKQLFPNDDYINNVHLKFKFFLFGCIVFTFRIDEINSQNYMKLTFESIKQHNLRLPPIPDFEQICQSNCKLCNIQFNNQDIIINKKLDNYHKDCNKSKDIRQTKIWKLIIQ